MSRNTNILVCGIGGQGVMTATEILAEAALALGFDAKKTEVAGMSQRGGVVTSHLRFGPQVLSPQIMPGDADLLVGFEAAEALRWAHMLKPGGVALVNQGRLVPPVVNIAYQVAAWMSGKPASPVVGRSGRAALRRGPAIASARTVPAWICGCMGASALVKTWMRPATTSFIAGPVPR